MNKAVYGGRGRGQISINNDINNFLFAIVVNAIPYVPSFESGLSDCLVIKIRWKCYYNTFQAQGMPHLLEPRPHGTMKPKLPHGEVHLGRN